MKMPFLNRIVFSLVAIFLVVGSHIADYSSTHIFNPNWPPHAKFHTGQTLMFSIVLALLTIFYANRKSATLRENIFVTALFASLYWITQAGAILYPGTDFWDSPAHAVHILGLPAQLFIDIVFLAVIWINVRFALKRT